MGCSHAAACPLFPLLRASLQGWRNYYCDSADRWRECARYELSLTGERVPISLLPNGATARHLERDADANRSGVAGPKQTPRHTPPSQPGPWSPETESWSQPVPVGSPEPSEPGTAAAETTARPEATLTPAPIRPHPSSPSIRITQPPDRPMGHRRQASSPKRGWWARLADWMRNPV